MKRLVTLAVLTVGVLAPGAAFAGEQTVKLALANMSCATCPPIVRKSLSALAGVSKVIVSLEQQSALVTFDDEKTSVEALIAATTNAGYPAKLIGQGS
jgi:mercuric ion binding protein